MKFLLTLALALATVVLTPHDGDARRRLQEPVPLPPILAAFAQATNPDPFNIARKDPSVVSAPTPAPVVISVPAPMPGPESKSQNLRDWVHTALYAFLTAIAGWLGLKLPSSLSGNPKLDQGKIKDIVASVLNPQNADSILKDPTLKASVDVALLQAIQSGVPGQALQGGLSLIPGAGPFVTALEPALRKIVIDVLQSHVADPKVAAGATDARLGKIEDLLKAFVPAKPTA